MNLTFRIRFATRPGQSLWLVRGETLSGGSPLQFLDSESWQIKLSLAAGAEKTPLNYSYILHNPGGTQTADWGRDRVLVPAGFDCKELLVIDSWNDAGFFGNAFYTEPFKKVPFAEHFTEVKTIPPRNPTHTFRVKWPLPAKDQTVCLLGEGATLGHWNTRSPILLGRRPDEDYFSVQLDLRGQTFPLTYKYGIFDVANKTFVRYEDGADRILKDQIAPDKHTVVHDGFVVLPPRHWRGAGVAVPVFSLRGENSFGVGEFADLKLLADWGKKVGLKLIQLLPVNDTSATHSWRDSYPYAAISAFALHPIYLNLAAVANAKNRKLLQALEPERRRLNSLDTVDYEAVMSAKLGFLKAVFPLQKTATFRSREYKDFFEENKHWLVPYSAFCFLRDKFGTPDFSRWPEHNNFDAGKIGALVNGNDEIAFHFFVQYHLHLQLRDATAHVHSAGLALKGDVAIGVFRHGADTWQQPELFHMDMQAGAPPDAFAAKGQNWGFPTYNWPRMAADGFAWWKQRFEQMGKYFDAFRIDHILGFFRIWSSPAHAVEGILGHFVPAIAIEQNEFSARGIFLDRERLTKPFITDAVLREIFGDESQTVRGEFLKEDPGGGYSLKPGFATQKQVEEHFAAREQNGRDAKLKAGLFDLISNVILLEVEGKFHFRFAMEQTLSFKNLGPGHAGEAARFVCGLFFPAAGRFLGARGDAKTARSQARDEHAHLRRRPWPRARVRAAGDARPRIFEPRNPAHAENSRPGIFAPGGCAVFERGHAVHTRHEHDPRLVDGRPRVDAKVFSTANWACPARRRSNVNRKSSRRSCGNISRHRRCGVFSSCRICWAWTAICAAPMRQPSASTCRRSRIITGATGCIWRWRNCSGRKHSICNWLSCFARTDVELQKKKPGFETGLYQPMNAPTNYLRRRMSRDAIRPDNPNTARVDGSGTDTVKYSSGLLAKLNVVVPKLPVPTPNPGRN